MSALRIEREGAIARVWLDRPEVRNALSGALIAELASTSERWPKTTACA
jgi:Enoyl-CoA hydratase/carnithine racemase